MNIPGTYVLHGMPGIDRPTRCCCEQEKGYQLKTASLYLSQSFTKYTGIYRKSEYIQQHWKCTVTDNIMPEFLRNCKIKMYLELEWGKIVQAVNACQIFMCHLFTLPVHQEGGWKMGYERQTKFLETRTWTRNKAYKMSFHQFFKNIALPCRWTNSQVPWAILLPHVMG